MEPELSDVEWEREIRLAVAEFRKAIWQEKKRDRAERESNPWMA
jgi:hypothetical protein